jgi:hypothetical protein
VQSRGFAFIGKEEQVRLLTSLLHQQGRMAGPQGRLRARRRERNGCEKLNRVQKESNRNATKS